MKERKKRWGREVGEKGGGRQCEEEEGTKEVKRTLKKPESFIEPVCSSELISELIPSCLRSQSNLKF